MKQTPLLALFLGLSLSLSAQNSATLEGTLRDAAGQPIAYANVLALQAQDSSLIKANLSEPDGRFRLTELPAGPLLLHLSLLGYQEQYVLLKLPAGTTTTLDPITLATMALELETAVVKAKKPFLEQKAGMMVVNVANSITAANGSVIDVLRKVPGLLIINNQISLAGQQGLNILIDGRPTQYLDMQSLLRDMPAANIEKIEVISQPGASFDAQGTGAIINIVLKRNLKLGLNGSATVGGGMGRFGKFNSSGMLNYRNGKINLSNALAFNHRSWFEELRLDRVVNTEIFRQNNFQPNFPYSLNLKSGVDYFITNQQTAGLALNLVGSSNRSTDNNRTLILADANPSSIREDLSTTNTIKRRWGFVNLDAYYEIKLDTQGQKLNVDLSFNRYGRDVSNLLATTVSAGETIYPDRQQLQPGATAIAAYRIDYTTPLNPLVNLEAGLKYSAAEIDNDFQANVASGGVFVPDPALTNHFIFTENIAAGYASATYRQRGVEIKAGLRYENSLSKGYSVTLDSSQVRRISRVFPSFSVAAPLVEKLGWALAYSNRINRPAYNTLNPFVRFLDPYTYEKGNPFLLPEFSHNYKFSLTYDQQPFFNLEYTRTNNAINMIFDQDPVTGVGFGVNENLSNFERYGGSLFFPLEFVKKLSGYGGVMVYYNQYNSEVLRALYEDGRWNAVAFLQATYELSKNWKLEANGWYAGPGIEGLQRTEHLFGFGLGLQGKAWGDKGRFSISADDLLFRYFFSSINHANFEADVNSRWETRVLNVSFTYVFGNQSLKKVERRNSGAEEEKQRNREK